MSKDNSSGGCGCVSPIYVILGILTAMISYTMHKSIFWSIMSFVFWWFAWLKWIIFREINITIIKETFYWFFQ